MNKRESDVLKGQFINDVIVAMNTCCDKQTLQILEHTLRAKLQNLFISEDKSLPAINENMNDRVLEIYLAKKSFEVCTNTITAYRGYLRKFFDFINIDYREVTDNVIYVYLQHCRKSMKNSSLNNVRRAISLFFDWCYCLDKHHHLF